MPDTYESYLEGSITVVRQAISGRRVAALLKDARAIQADARQYATGYQKHQGKGSPEPVHQAHRFLTDIRGTGYQRTARFLGKWCAAHTAVATVNHQPPLSYQAFHRDLEMVPATIIHLSDGGMFDYVPNEAEQNLPPYMFQMYEYDTILVNAGDIMKITDPRLIHRGRNASNVDRFNIGLYDNA